MKDLSLKDEQEIPKGTEKADYQARKKFITDFYINWISINPAKTTEKLAWYRIIIQSLYNSGAKIVLFFELTKINK